MRFRTESDLVEHSLPLIPQCFQSHNRGSRLAREVGVGRNIADMVLLLQSNRSTAPTLGTFTTTESVVLASLRRKGATRIDLLEARCGLERNQLRVGALDRLLEWGLLQRQRGGRISLHSTHASDVRIVAIEAKLTRWSQALKQAVQYGRYADHSYVLLPASCAGPALAQAHFFESSGIGLLVADANAVTMCIEASNALDHDWRREFVYSRLLQHKETHFAY